ncbi:MAG TPA: GtrA family protein [Caulobacteraceae bacterium]|nr:GtrA family protein [Caulobacteraceae bacterium]
MGEGFLTRLKTPATARYFTIQGLGYGIDVGGFWLLFHLAGVPPLVANLISKAAAATFAFFGHRLITFIHHEKVDIGPQAIKYIVLLLLNTALNSTILAALLYMHAPTLPAKVGTDVSCIVLTYFAMKHFVYRPPAPSEAPTSDSL